jgi:hypothetical protein
MATYERASKETEKQVARVMKRYHSALEEAGVTVDVLMAYARRDGNGDPVGAALKLAGYQCIGTIRIIGTKDRAAGRRDTELLLDGDRFTELSGEEQDSVIDHELTHLELKVGDDGLRHDDLGRPKLRLRLHDHQFGWFDEIVRKHARDSIECQQFEHFMEASYKQLWLPFIEEGART